MILRRNPAGFDGTAPWPASGTWELQDLYHDLRDSVMALEAAWTAGRLAEELTNPHLESAVGTDLLLAYHDLARRPVPADRERRRLAVHALLDQLHAEVFRVDRWGDFAIEARAPVDAPVYRTELEDAPPALQRLDQLVARRFWGIGFVSDDVELTDAVSREAVRSGVERLSRDLIDVAKVLRRPHPPPALVPMVPGHHDRSFEQLMLDILVENRPRARTARLREDFCQKTDLRVRYAGLDRSRGARVQVKATANVERHRERVADIRRREHLVILSPVRLAEFVASQLRSTDCNALSRKDLREFWGSLPDQPLEIGELSYSIKEVLLRGIAQPTVDPRGPMGSVPEPVRRVIRAFVRAESFRSTAALRRDIAGGARLQERADGRLHFRGAPSRRTPRRTHRDGLQA